jgi:hypothetical protein
MITNVRPAYRPGGLHGTIATVVILVTGAQPSIWTWLGPVLAFCGSLVVAAVALITVWQTNKRTDKRELNQWRRDTLLRLGVEVTESTTRAMNQINAIAEYHDDSSSKEIEQLADGVDEWVLEIIGARHGLKLIGSDRAAELADKLWGEINKSELREAAKAYRLRRLDKLATQQQKEAAKQRFEVLWKAVTPVNNEFTDAVELDIERMP